MSLMLSRRVLLPLPAALLLARCAAGGNAVPLAQVQMYADDLIGALSAAGQAFLATATGAQAELVTTIVADLQQAKTAIDSAQTASDARAIALEVVSFAQQIEPLVAPFLGPAAPYVPLAIAVLQAFINALPPPPAAPPTPPVQLHRMALRYHG